MKRILFVDDFINWHPILIEILSRIGDFDIKGFVNGNELFEHYKKLNKYGETVDLILIDCFMINMSGFETLKEIMKINSNAHVIMMTGVHRQNVIDGIKLGAKGFIWKPYDEANIKEVFNKHL
ncbi:response regulator [Neobacillus sp. YIM B06451]|uniref:response regulator n=1 Tax=Neobacillus sp. YIM B06451 TaxID=3070994 RepID=UPI002930BECA|nr:response regulator [Neobacillus sp. YIM B06451]